VIVPRKSPRGQATPAARQDYGGWVPSLGAWPDAGGTRFRVWAPDVRSLEVIIAGREREPLPMTRDARACWEAHAEDVGAGDRYWYRLDGERLLPDPASRFQPEGVHGPSQVIDPRTFVWTDGGWTGISRDQVILYELHVGTFSPIGTFTGAAAKLDELAGLGVTAIELMPIAEFPGDRNWGYDGVDLFAPSRAYGAPDDLRALVDRAHALGLAVLLDVVYNHLGPEGAYLTAYARSYFTDRHRSPWGAGVNLDGDHSRHVRTFLFENALHWLVEYHVDGFRLDATHALSDDSPDHFLAEFVGRVHRHQPRALVIAEDDRKLHRMVRSRDSDGWGFDAVWADDFHHQVRRLLAGDHESYFAQYSGSVTDIVRTVAHGWFLRRTDDGEIEEVAASDPAVGGVPAQYVICLQNHDQIGNRALGERLHHQIELATYRAASVLLLCAPETPLLFMGQEWAASTPFQYFTDHPEPLGRLVTEGRRNEFGAFVQFRDPALRSRIPDPQARATFEASRLRWDERTREPHLSVLRLYETLLTMRRTLPALYDPEGTVRVEALDADTLALRRDAANGRSALVAIIRLRGAGRIELRRATGELVSLDDRLVLTLSTESPAFAGDSAPLQLTMDGGMLGVRFERPGAVVLTS
jgi:maltooligosyltrehalose trehalohydrolase